ncbi:MAG: hypothetical protein AAGN66_05060 [Acidobacteriota bacterium]
MNRISARLSGPFLLTCLAALALLTPQVWGQSIDITDDESFVIPDKEAPSKFRWFGSVSWAYGKTDGVKYRGVTEDGTGDLYNAAFQLRYAWDDRNSAVLQLASERVGTSPTNRFRNDVEVDWLFWDHAFVDGTRLRVGRVPLPIGFYNEIKDIGTALPFYRPSGNFYGEGTWTSDSVDGVVVSRDLADLSGWLIYGDAYYGEWERIENDGSSLTVGEAEIEDALGFYAWAESPSGRFRLGLGANRFDATGGVFLPPGVSDEEKTRYLSMETSGERWTLRFEISRRTFTGGYWQPYYLELVVRPTDRLQVAAIYDVGHLDFTVPFFASFDDTIEEAQGLAVSYALRSDLVLKAEHHWVEGYGQIEDRSLSFFFDPPESTNLLIVGAAWTF